MWNKLLIIIGLVAVACCIDVVTRATHAHNWGECFLYAGLMVLNAACLATNVRKAIKDANR